MLSSITTLLDAYEHRVRNGSSYPVRVTLFLQFSTAEMTLAPHEAQSIGGSPLNRLTSVLVEYRGTDPRLSGLAARWTPRGTPPVSTTVSINTDIWPYGPDETTDSMGEPLVQPPHPKRHTQFQVWAQEFQ